MAYRNTFFRWLFLYSLTFGLTYVLKLDSFVEKLGAMTFLFGWNR